VNLIYIERLNRLTERIIAVRAEKEERERKGPHPRVGAWRHQYNLTRLEALAVKLETQRRALFRPDGPR
jgi:hypothetical protein